MTVLTHYLYPGHSQVSMLHAKNRKAWYTWSRESRTVINVQFKASVLWQCSTQYHHIVHCCSPSDHGLQHRPTPMFIIFGKLVKQVTC